ncbi:MAG: NAD-dependent malic enzyme [Deltaproteobacteria bacterium]|nr:MAG: NAD-dependent malic enzyme [Deltaproteobacteria bacterium]
MTNQDTRQFQPIPTGHQILNDHFYNKGTAFTEAEREALEIDGLLPPVVNTLEEQVVRVMENFRKKPSDIEKYIFMMALLDRNLTLYDRVLVDHIEEMMPIIYTPTVGQACLEYSHIFRKPQGIFLSANQKGRFTGLLRQWPEKDVKIIVVTDGERILGLGDLGAAGMGIPVGKLSLYIACAGIHPRYCLPVLIDVGTNNVKFLSDPLYIGLKQERLRGQAYDELIQEFVTAVQDVFPDAVIQFEDFGNVNAFRLLRAYRHRCCTFNDDIQGTACVALAGLYSAMRMIGGKLTEQKVLFLGAGEAGTGIGELFVSAMVRMGLTETDARKRCWFVDSKGLVVKNREYLPEHKVPFAQDHPPIPDFLSVLRVVRPSVIIGVSGQTGKFDKNVLQQMAEINPRPIIFALSNPTSKSECTAEEAYVWTEGRAIFASGSPFDSVTIAGRTHEPAQSNNAYVFPGIGLGVIASKSRHVSDEMFRVAARVLAEQTSESDFKCGRLYPPFKDIRQVSLKIATAVAEQAFEAGLARVDLPDNVEAYVQTLMYEPQYESYI